MFINNTLNNFTDAIPCWVSHRQRVNIIGWYLLMWAPIASCSINVLERFDFDRSLEIEIISGYPYNYKNIEDHLTLGVLFHNHGTQRQLRLELSGDMNTTRDISLPASETRRVFIYMPHFTNPSIQVALTDKVTGFSSPSRYLRMSGGFSSSFDRPHHTLARLGLFSVPINVSGEWEDLGRIDTTDKMPDHWRGLTGVTAMVVEHDHLLANHPWKQTILEWVMMGGTLLVTTTDKTPVDFEAVWKTLPFVPENQPIGRIWDRQKQVGFGHIAMIPATALADIDTYFLQKIGVKVPALVDNQQIRLQQTAEFLHQLLPDIGQVPRWTLFLILISFALLIGPLGWFYLVKKKGRPFIYLVLVIGAAGVFSSSMLVATFLADGITPKGVTHSLRFLDLRTDTQITMQQVAVFVPTQYDTTVRIPTGGSVLLFPLQTDSRRGWNYTLTVDTAWETLEDIIPVRQRRLIGTRNLSRTQGRLVFTTDNNRLRVENHLQGALSSLQVWQEGFYYAFDAIARGEAAVAQPLETLNPNSLSLPSPSQLMMEGVTLYNRLQKGELGTRYFIGTFESADTERFLFPKGFREISQGQHVVAGIY